LPKSRFLTALLTIVSATTVAQTSSAPEHVLGFHDFAQQAKIDRQFLAVPDAGLAREELKTLTAVPHVAASKEDHDTALYVASKFKAAGLDTQIVPYKAWLNLPQEVFLQVASNDGKVIMTGPTREHVDHDPYQEDPRILTAFNGSSPSCDLTADVVYANYARPEDFKKLDDLHVSVAGKIVLARYGMNFRGVKVYLAQQRQAAGIIIYSDPADDGYFQGDKYPHGPWRPDTGVQRGSVQYMFKYPGDATTPNVASTPALAAGKRLPPSQVSSLPTVPSMPLSYHDASPILESIGGPVAPREWQGALPFSYHVGGAGLVKAHLRLKMDYAERTIWDVVGKIPGTELPDEWVVTGNHRDAWVFGAVDPGSGTTAMLEAVHGIGALLAQGWKPRRTMFFCSWDAEEEGLIGSTEWAEEHAAQLAHAVAYINTDASVSGPRFEASAVPSLKQFVRDVTMEVSSPKGGSVYDQWQKDQGEAAGRRHTGNAYNGTQTVTQWNGEVRVGDLGSGSDYTPFLQHLGVPSTDIGSTGPYGVYHSAFDNYAWFLMNADPTFVYEQQMARVLGLETLHMANADVLPYDYANYARQIHTYLQAAQGRAKDAGLAALDFNAALGAVNRFSAQASIVFAKQLTATGNMTALNAALRAVETDLLAPEGLPGRPWFRHIIFAPGEYTGYAAVVIPGVNEAIDAHDLPRAQAQMANITAALVRATATLEEVQ
jgi:N-acetylated-alpha-linked acidic dipeptidase